MTKRDMEELRELESLNEMRVLSKRQEIRLARLKREYREILHAFK